MSGAATEVDLTYHYDVRCFSDRFALALTKLLRFSRTRFSPNVTGIARSF